MNPKIQEAAERIVARLSELDHDLLAAPRNKRVDIVETELVKLLPQWISVEDRLPEKYQDVRVYGWRHRWRSRTQDEGWIDADGSWAIDGVKDFKITHWMPLPEPPEGENERVR